MIKPMTDFFTEDDCDETVVWHTPKRSGKTLCLSLTKANRLLRERGKVVYGDEDSDKHGWVPESCIQEFGATVKGLIINIEPIEQDSAEKMLKDWLNLESGHADQFRDEERIRARAKALLRKGSGEK